MSYIRDSLTKDEEVLQLFETHWIVYSLVIIQLLVVVMTNGLWMPIAIYIFLYFRFLEQGLTNRRVIFKEGVISRSTSEMRLNAIESVYLRQGVFGRLMGFGNVIVAGRGQGDVHLKWIKDPMRAKREIELLNGVQ